MKKKLISSIFIMILILSITMISYGATASLSLTADKSTIEAGETVTLTLSIKETDITDGIYTLEGEIDYDTAIFETIADPEDATTEGSSITGTNNWSVDYNTANKKFIGTGNGNTSGNIVQIRLKVKEEVETQSTTVTIKNLVTADDQNEIEVDDVSYTFNVQGQEETPTITPTPTPDDPSSGNSGGSNSGGSTSSGSASGEDTTKSPNKLPAAGRVAISIGTVAMIVIVTTFGILYNKYKNILK